MDTQLKKLEKILKSELDIHALFLDSSHAFNRAIKEENVDKIDQQRLVHDETMCRIEKLEEERKECCEVLAQSLGIVKKPLRMAILLEKLPTPWKTRLSSIQKTLKVKVNELSKSTISNRILLEEGLRMVGHTFSAIHKSGNKYTAYGKRGQSTAGPSLQTIINRTV